MLLGELDNNTMVDVLKRNDEVIYEKPSKSKVMSDIESKGFTLKAAESLAHKNRRQNWSVKVDGYTYVRKGRRNWVRI